MFNQHDIEALTYKELQELEVRVQHAKASREKQARIEAFEAIKLKAEEFGFDISEFTAEGPAAPAKRTILPKYIDPENPDNTWTGRGRKPSWVNEFIENGGNMKEIEI